MLRDAALTVSGLLNPALGGPPVRPHQPDGVWEEIFMGRFTYEPSQGAAQYRRTLYAFWRRSIAPTFLFDSAQRRVCEVGMSRTNTPLQALTLLNDQTMMEASQALAAQMLVRSQSPAQRLNWLTQQVLSRPATAQEILNAMNRLGRTDAKLTPLLNQAIGRQSGAPEYDPERVAAVVGAIREGKGDAKRGAEVYRMAQLACVACHQIGDEGGVIGPALNGVGAGMPLDQIVESILWPNRQIKEGFQAVAFTTTAGAAITGYVERESDDIVWYRDTATPWIKPLAKKDIASREVIPTLMPPHLTASLTDEQFLDLVAYLASRYFGMGHYGRIYGSLYMVFGMASAASPVFYGAVRDASGSYDQALLVAGVLFVLGGVLLLALGRYPERFPVTAVSGAAPIQGGASPRE
jgi:putative heme-binding domain-containing protein